MQKISFEFSPDIGRICTSMIDATKNSVWFSVDWTRTFRCLHDLEKARRVNVARLGRSFLTLWVDLLAFCGIYTRGSCPFKRACDAVFGSTIRQEGSPQSVVLSPGAKTCTGWHRRDGEKMNARGKRLLHRDFWPVLVTGFLLATPAMAADPMDQLNSAVTQPGKTAPQTTKQAAKSDTKKPAPRTTLAAKAVTKKVTASVTPYAIATHLTPIAAGIPLTQVHRVAQADGGAAAQGFDRALLDDGTFWREEGSSATWQQTGMASWYGGPRWQGKRTTSGERYDQNKLTAAHATLPIGTQVRVMRTDGRGSVIVTINDRPGSRTRIIDLSREAAKELGILTAGVTMVTLQPL